MTLTVLSTGNTLRPDAPFAVSPSVTAGLRTTLLGRATELTPLKKGDITLYTAASAELLETLDAAPSVELTAKLFFPGNVSREQAIGTAKSALWLLVNAAPSSVGAPLVKSVIFSFGGLAFSDDDDEPDAASFTLTPEQVFAVWAEATAAAQKLGLGDAEFGVAEFSTQALQELVLRVGQGVAPVAIDHINASDCCALPKTLVEFSKTNNIKLLAHHDKPAAQLVDGGELAQITSELKLGAVDQWAWVLKLTALERDRQLLVGNEYLVAL